MLIAIRHLTRYTYETPARYAVQTLRLTPPSFAAQGVHSWTISAPGISRAVHFKDGFGNAACLLTQTELHTEIEIIAEGVVETNDRAGVVKGLLEMAPARVFLRETPATVASEAIATLAASVKADNTLGRLHALMEAIRSRIDYARGATRHATTAAEAFALGKGVCQDHTHIFIAACRSQDIPARYVNGYFLSGAPSEPAHHAWAEAYVEGLGWVGFDVANLVCPDDRFVRLACGLDAASASPIRGMRPLPLGVPSGAEHLDVTVEVHKQQSQSQSQQ